jgi:very-short-patch-repair endonuclease
MGLSRLVNVSKHFHGAPLSIKSKAKQLRKNMTRQEITLWKCLKKGKIIGLHFRRQHPYGIYILDFYCFKVELVVEVDGDIHFSRQEYDMERTNYLESTGLKVLRFKNEDIEIRLDWVLEEIRKAAIKRLTTPNSPTETK